jgi:small nuclear ribonucleoprotein (snRNP)-like protein
VAPAAIERLFGVDRGNRNEIGPGSKSHGMENDPGRLVRLLQQSVEVQVSETRMFRGVLLGFDKHLNVILNECEEYKLIGDEILSDPRGLIILRGINVQSVAANTLAMPRGREARSLWQMNIGTVSPLTRAPT